MSKGLSDLRRNDTKGALAFVRASLDAGTFTSDDGQTLMMLQDNPIELAAAVNEEIARRRREGLPIGPFDDRAEDTDLTEVPPRG